MELTDTLTHARAQASHPDSAEDEGVSGEQKHACGGGRTLRLHGRRFRQRHDECGSTRADGDQCVEHAAHVKEALTNGPEVSVSVHYRFILIAGFLGATFLTFAHLAILHQPGGFPLFKTSQAFIFRR